MECESPTPQQIKESRLKAGLTQAEAAAKVFSGSYRTWQNWEAGKRKMPVAKWELWLLMIKS